MMRPLDIITEPDNTIIDMKKRRFFYHYRRSTGGMTVHYKGQCYPCKDVMCIVPTETYHRKDQPRLVIRGFCKAIRIEGDTIIIA